MEGFKVCVFMVSFLKQYQCDNIPNWSPNFVVVLFRFLPHFQASSALDDVTIPRKHAALVAGRDYDEGSFGADDKVSIQGHLRVIQKVKAWGSAAIFSWLSRLWLGVKEVARWNLVSIWRNIRKMNRTGQSLSKPFRTCSRSIRTFYSWRLRTRGKPSERGDDNKNNIRTVRNTCAF